MPRLYALAVGAALIAGAELLPSAHAQPAPAVPPAAVSRAEFIAMMDAEFRERDADKDSFITRAELEQHERDLVRAAALTQNAQIFTRLDTDRNGALSQAEFAALVAQPPPPDMTQQLQRFDRNRDGKITLIEHRATTLVNFDKLDTDFDGIVSDAEMKAGKVQSPAPSGR